jgi:hypothetical protein
MFNYPVVFFLLQLVSVQMPGQGTASSSAPAKSPDAARDPWAFNLTIDGYIIPHETSYANPVFSADHHWLHLEARYNYENLRTGSLWIGRNFSAGKKLVLTGIPHMASVCDPKSTAPVV